MLLISYFKGYDNLMNKSGHMFMFCCMLFVVVALGCNEKLILAQQLKLEEAMAPHSSTLAWKIPWTEEPGGLQSMWSWTGQTPELSIHCFSPSSIRFPLNRFFFFLTLFPHQVIWKQLIITCSIAWSTALPMPMPISWWLRFICLRKNSNCVLSLLNYAWAMILR